MPEARKDQLEKSRLKEAVRSVILTQGNEFIKELLRKHNIQMGTKKADFSKNLLTAIDYGNVQGGDKAGQWIVGAGSMRAV